MTQKPSVWMVCPVNKTALCGEEVKWISLWELLAIVLGEKDVCQPDRRFLSPE